MKHAFFKVMGCMLAGGVAGMCALPLLLVTGTSEVTAALIGVVVANGGLAIGGIIGLIWIRK